MQYHNVLYFTVIIIRNSSYTIIFLNFIYCFRFLLLLYYFTFIATEFIFNTNLYGFYALIHFVIGSAIRFASATTTLVDQSIH